MKKNLSLGSTLLTHYRAFPAKVHRLRSPLTSSTREKTSQLPSSARLKTPPSSPPGEDGLLASILTTLDTEEAVKSTLTAAERAIFEQIYQDAVRPPLHYTNTEEEDVERLINVSSLDQSVNQLVYQVSEEEEKAIEDVYQSHNSARSLFDTGRYMGIGRRGNVYKDLSHVPKKTMVYESQSCDDSDVNILRRHKSVMSPTNQEMATHSVTGETTKHLESGVPDHNTVGQVWARKVFEARRDDASRIERLFQLARTDTDIWRVLQDHVFPDFVNFLKAINIETKPQTRGKRGRKSNQVSELDLLRALGGTLGLDSYPRLSLLFEVLRTNYPQHCRAALRMLRERFPRSPYATAILPTIKSLGPISYVLGASTELYDELLFLRWAHYRDLHACADLRAEMLNRGIHSSRYTSSFFRDAALHWLRMRTARVQPNTSAASAENQQQMAGEKDVHSSSLDCGSGEAASMHLTPFETAWWSLEGVKSGFARWKQLEEEAKQRQGEEEQGRKRQREYVTWDGELEDESGAISV